ncbi:glycosyltransferase [Streptomyces niveiscabiei]|uniref:glycosyltransferase n=1 Tax=Streptomyces niveiscabiei TaxID=164115 RepID=UPI0029A37E66|nr:glycosyltransferase [Streptomyces niveiscabiei]MDX3388301.1 glycosyltransferase [Streptomyces niveiscabiei]
MRLLLISDHADPLAQPGSGFSGGQNVYVRNLAARLAAIRNTVDVVTRRESPALPHQQPITDGARVVRVTAGACGPLPRDRFGEVLDAFTEGVDQVFRTDGPYDVVHSHYWYSGQTALALAERHNVPVVHTHHSLGAVRRAAQGERLSAHAQDHFDVRHRAESRIGQHAAALVVNCPAEAYDAHRLCATPLERVRLVPPGVDTSVLRPVPQEEARAALGVPVGVPVVLFLGRLEQRKGWEEAVEAFALVRRRLPRARLVVVGGSAQSHGPGTGLLVALARELGVLAGVDLRGSVPHEETALYYNAADVTAVPSHYEPFGLVAVESMACGTPVAATRVGGLAWSVGDERVGALVPARDSGALGNALLGILDKGRAHFHQACLDRVASTFTAQAWADGIREVYRSVSPLPRN